MDLVICLQMGAIIDYNADRTFVVRRGQELYGTSHDIMPITLSPPPTAHCGRLGWGHLCAWGRQVDMVTFKCAAAHWREVCGEADGIRFYPPGPLKSIALRPTSTGFMTDWQPPFVLLLTQAEGMSVVHETVFEDRFGYVAALHKMGADMALYDTCLGGAPCRFHSSNYKHSCIIKGPMHLRGAHITVPDLRAGFTYLIAAVLAQGQSIEGLSHIDVRRENLEDSLRRLGVRINKVPE